MAGHNRRIESGALRLLLKVLPDCDRVAKALDVEITRLRRHQGIEDQGVAGNRGDHHGRQPQRPSRAAGCCWQLLRL